MMINYRPHHLKAWRALPLAASMALPFTALTFAAGIFVGTSRPAEAQSKAPIQRVVEGKVTDKSGTILPGAIVYLKNSKTLAIKSFIADDAGHFRFGQLSTAADYDLWAEQNGQRSKTKSISSFNDKSNLVFTLTIDI